MTDEEKIVEYYWDSLMKHFEKINQTELFEIYSKHADSLQRDRCVIPINQCHVLLCWGVVFNAGYPELYQLAMFHPLEKPIKPPISYYVPIKRWADLYKYLPFLKQY
jgi:hypothetical protein